MNYHQNFAAIGLQKTNPASGWLVKKSQRQLFDFLTPTEAVTENLHINIWLLRNITNPAGWDSVKTVLKTLKTFLIFLPKTMIESYSMFCVGCPAEDGQPGLEGVLHEAEHQVYPARPRGIGRRSSSDPGTYI